MNHYDTVERAANAVTGYYTNRFYEMDSAMQRAMWLAYQTARCVGNQTLAHEADREDGLIELRALAKSVPIFDALVREDACIRGLTRVGVHAVSWGHLGACIRELDSWDSDGDCERDSAGYLEWCEDHLDELTYGLVLAGFENA